MRLLSLDTSSVCVGYAVFDDKRLVTFGKHVQVGKEHGEKFSTFLQWLIALLKLHKPDAVVVELPFGGPRRGYTYGVLMQYIAVVMLAHFDVFGKELPDQNKVQAKKVKLMMEVESGKNHDQNKQIMVDRVNRLFKLNLKFVKKDPHKKLSQDDIADAIAVGHTWLLLRETPNELNRRPVNRRNRVRTRTRKASPRR